MANTYTQLLIQYVFAVKNRDALINGQIRDRVEKYITGVATNNKHKLLAIYCMPDHCHILVGQHPTQSISDFAKDLKANSSKWINNEKLANHQFNWQEGFGAFSYSKSQLNTVVNYILNQAQHHQQVTFRDEYMDFLAKFEVEHDLKYLFDWLDN